MTSDLFFNCIIERLINRVMKMIMSVAIVLGIGYACVAPWFYCKSNTTEEEAQTRNKPECDTDVSSTNQTLTSTNIRITGLRGLNFVSVTLPNSSRSMSRMSGHSSEALSRIRNSSQHMNSRGQSVQNPLITYPDISKRMTIPDIKISPASIDTTVYPLSSSTTSHSLISRESLRMQRVDSTDSNYSRGDAIRSFAANNKNLTDRRMSQLKIRKPPRAHPPNTRFSQNSFSSSKYLQNIHNSNSLSSLNTLNGSEILQNKNFNDNQISTPNKFSQCENSRSLSVPSNVVNEKSSCDTQMHSLYPNVNIVIGKNNSSIRTLSSSNDYQNTKNIIEQSDLVSEYPTSNLQVMDSNLSLTNNIPSGICTSKSSSTKSRSKSTISHFFSKKCKKLWMNVNKRNCDNSKKSKSSIECVIKNNPMCHSTVCEKSNVSHDVEGHSNQHSNHYDEQCLVVQDTPHYLTPNAYERMKKTNTPSTVSSISSEVKITNHCSLPCRTKFENFNDEPLDLSIKSQLNQTDIDIEKNGIDNCTSDSSFTFKFKKRPNFSFPQTIIKKFPMKKKWRSLPERDEISILKSISIFCHRSQEYEDENWKTHLEDSTNYPELKSRYSTRYVF